MYSLQNLRKLLTGADFNGVGNSTVEKIINAFGETLYEILDRENRDKLAEVITAHKADLLIAGWRRVVAQQEIVRWLDRYGIEPSIGAIVFRTWGNRSLEKLEANPYRLLAMASWNSVDRLAKRLGISANHPVRLIGAAEQATYTHIDEYGSTWISSEDLKAAIAKLLGKRWDSSLPQLDQVSLEAVKLAVETQSLLPVDSGFQVPGAFFMERQIEDWIQHCMKLPTLLSDFSGVLDAFQESEGITLTEEQRKAVSNALGDRISVFYGGADVGKTFVIKAICAVSELLGKRPILLALAAKAVRKMATSTGRDAMTLARALHRMKISDFANTIVVIDEFSMVDMLDFRSLIQRLPNNAQLVLCGDAAQLPSIGPGRLLYSFVHSSLIPAQELTITHRQTSETGIPQKLSSIRNGALPLLPVFNWNSPWNEGIFLIPCDSKTLPPLVTKLYDLFEGEAQIISPLAESTVGVRALNRRIHQHVTGTYELRPNTPVVFVVNTKLSSGVKVVNGLQGHIRTVINANPRHPDLAHVEVEAENERIVCSLRDVEASLELSYALTVHRAQGSDWETVIAVLPPSRLLERAMVYTALSRCKQRCIILAPDLGRLGEAVANPPSYETREDRLFHKPDPEESMLTLAGATNSR